MNAKSTKNVKQTLLLQSLYKQELKEVKFTKLSVLFYPYKSLTHKIKLENDLVKVKLSDLVKEAPLEVHRAIARILVSKLLRRKISQKDRKTYEDFLKSESEKIREELRKRLKPNSKGEFYDLEEIFENVNRTYFNNAIPKPIIRWSPRKTKKRLGYCNLTRSVITVSRSLDDKRVPRYVLDYVMYHELLHIKHQFSNRNGKNFVHTKEFRKDERKFKNFEKAQKWLIDWFQKKD